MSKGCFAVLMVKVRVRLIKLKSKLNYSAHVPSGCFICGQTLMVRHQKLQCLMANDDACLEPECRAERLHWCFQSHRSKAHYI